MDLELRQRILHKKASEYANTPAVHNYHRLANQIFDLYRSDHQYMMRSYLYDLNSIPECFKNEATQICKDESFIVYLVDRLFIENHMFANIGFMDKSMYDYCYGGSSLSVSTWEIYSDEQLLARYHEAGYNHAKVNGEIWLSSSEFDKYLGEEGAS